MGDFADDLNGTNGYFDDDTDEDDEIIGFYCLGCGWSTSQTRLDDPYCPRCSGMSLDPIYF